MTRGTRNSLGALRDVKSVVSVHYARAGTLVNLTDGTQMRITRRPAHLLRMEADRLELRASIIRAIAENGNGAGHA